MRMMEKRRGGWDGMGRDGGGQFFTITHDTLVVTKRTPNIATMPGQGRLPPTMLRPKLPPIEDDTAYYSSTTTMILALLVQRV